MLLDSYMHILTSLYDLVAIPREYYSDPDRLRCTPPYMDAPKNHIHDKNQIPDNVLISEYSNWLTENLNEFYIIVINLNYFHIGFLREEDYIAYQLAWTVDKK